jgi:hypothetical protein
MCIDVFDLHELDSKLTDVSRTQGFRFYAMGSPTTEASAARPVAGSSPAVGSGEAPAKDAFLFDGVSATGSVTTMVKWPTADRTKGL